MRKTFPLAVPGKHPERLLDATKHEIRKYVRRERRRVLPEGMDYWDFDCRFGPDEAGALPVHFATLTSLIDGVAQSGGSQFFVEILARAAKRGPRMARDNAPHDTLANAMKDEANGDAED